MTGVTRGAPDVRIGGSSQDNTQWLCGGVWRLNGQWSLSGCAVEWNQVEFKLILKISYTKNVIKSLYCSAVQPK